MASLLGQLCVHSRLGTGSLLAGRCGAFALLGAKSAGDMVAKAKSRGGRGASGSGGKASSKSVAKKGLAAAPSARAAKVSANGRRRQLERREAAERAERAIAARLSHLPKAMRATKRNGDGQSIQDFVEDSLRDIKGCSKKLSSRFWHDVYQMFDLAEDTAADLLDDPANPKEVPSPELLEVLSGLHSGNPVVVSVGPLERFLEHATTLHATDTFGLMHAVQAGQDLSHLNSVRAQVAILGFWARTFSCHRGRRFGFSWKLFACRSATDMEGAHGGRVLSGRCQLVWGSTGLGISQGCAEGRWGWVVGCFCFTIMDCPHGPMCGPSLTISFGALASRRGPLCI